MEQNDTIKVDLDKVLHDKNPRLARLLPRFVVSYLKRIVHQDEVNFILQNHSHLPAIDFVAAVLGYLDIHCVVDGLDRLSAGGRYLFASNHPFGGPDGMILAQQIHSRFGDTRIIVNDILMNVKPMQSLFVPINKHGRQNINYSKYYQDSLQSDAQIATFPAGLCSRRRHGVVMDLDWKQTFVKNAIDSKRDIVPVFFDGHLSNFFYRLSSIRTALGIKANLEMLYLVDEMFKLRGQTFSVTYLDPISWTDLQQNSPRFWAQEIKKQVYAAKK